MVESHKLVTSTAIFGTHYFQSTLQEERTGLHCEQIQCNKYDFDPQSLSAVYRKTINLFNSSLKKKEKKKKSCSYAFTSCIFLLIPLQTIPQARCFQLILTLSVYFFLENTPYSSFLYISSFSLFTVFRDMYAIYIHAAATTFQ